MIYFFRLSLPVLALPFFKVFSVIIFFRCGKLFENTLLLNWIVVGKDEQGLVIVCQIEILLNLLFIHNHDFVLNHQLRILMFQKWHIKVVFLFVGLCLHLFLLPKLELIASCEDQVIWICFKLRIKHKVIGVEGVKCNKRYLVIVWVHQMANKLHLVLQHSVIFRVWSKHLICVVHAKSEKCHVGEINLACVLLLLYFIGLAENIVLLDKFVDWEFFLFVFFELTWEHDVVSNVFWLLNVIAIKLVESVCDYVILLERVTVLISLIKQDTVPEVQNWSIPGSVRFMHDSFVDNDLLS